MQVLPLRVFFIQVLYYARDQIQRLEFVNTTFILPDALSHANGNKSFSKNLYSVLFYIQCKFSV